MENPASKGASMASAQGSTGVDQDRGMCEEKRKNDRPAEGGTLNSGRRMTVDAHETPERRRNECVTIHPPDKERRSQTAATLRSLTHVPQHPLGDVGVDGVGG